MMQGHDSAYPLDKAHDRKEPYDGLTKRELIAANNLKGILSSAYPSDGLTQSQVYEFVNDAVK